jgi:hypothetical protein
MRQFVWGADLLSVYEIVYAMSIETLKPTKTCHLAMCSGDGWAITN